MPAFFNSPIVSLATGPDGNVWFDANTNLPKPPSATTRLLLET